MKHPKKKRPRWPPRGPDGAVARPRTPNWNALAAVPSCNHFLLELSIELCIDAMRALTGPLADWEIEMFKQRRAQVVMASEGAIDYDVKLVTVLLGDGIESVRRSLWLELDAICYETERDVRLQRHSKAIRDWQAAWGDKAEANGARATLARFLRRPHKEAIGKKAMHALGVMALQACLRDVVSA